MPPPAHRIRMALKLQFRRNMANARDLLHQIVPAPEGFGPLLQRDYWAAIRHCGMRPSEIIKMVASRFKEFAPEELTEFCRRDGSEKPLEVGADMNIDIRLAGSCRVRVLHQDQNSFTLGTLEGHPEAGRITFGAYRNDAQDVVFHIRSRARSSSAINFIGFIGLGEAMQTNTWTDFVSRVALTAGEGVIGAIHAETNEIEDEPESSATLMSPTFIARGD